MSLTFDVNLADDSALFSFKGISAFKFFIWAVHIVGCTVGNLVLRRRARGNVKGDFRTYMYIPRYTSPKEYFEYGYPLSNALRTVTAVSSQI